MNSGVGGKWRYLHDRARFSGKMKCSPVRAHMFGRLSPQEPLDRRMWGQSTHEHRRGVACCCTTGSVHLTIPRDRENVRPTSSTSSVTALLDHQTKSSTTSHQALPIQKASDVAPITAPLRSRGNAETKVVTAAKPVSGHLATPAQAASQKPRRL